VLTFTKSVVSLWSYLIIHLFNIQMRKFKVQIVGVTPYMQHRMDDAKLKEWEQKRSRVIEREGLNSSEEKQALFHAYTTESGEYYIPSDHFKQSFVKGGATVKGKVGNATKSMKNVVAGMWAIKESQIPFRRFDEVDTRSAVNQNVKARVIVNRPKWLDWECEFTLTIDDDNTMTVGMINEIIKNAGRYLGVGSYRPEHTGEFGRFTHTLTELK